MSGAGVYARHAGDYLDAGLAVFPVDTDGKRPAVTGWQSAGQNAARAWIAKKGDCQGIGLVVGKRSRIVEVDVDAAGPAWLQLATEQFGELPVTIRTASGKAKIWYRHNGEGRSIRPFKDMPVDILGGGFTITPPSFHQGHGRAYAFMTGGLAELERLQPMRAEALAGRSFKPTHRVCTGERNTQLWRWCMAEARNCDDVEALIDAAESWTSCFDEPLPLKEIRAAAKSAWRYEVSGRNFIGRKNPQVVRSDEWMDQLSDAPDGFYLLSMFRRFHSNRGEFVIAPAAMSKAGAPPWHVSRIRRARDALLERGFLEQISAPQRGGKPGQYRLK